MKYSYLIILVFFSCSDQLIQTNTVEDHLVSDASFIEDLPKLINSAKANAFYSSTELTYTQNRLVGVGYINDKTFSVNVDPYSSFQSEDLEYRNDGNFKIFIDTSQVLTIDEYRLPDNFYESLPIEDLFGSNFQNILNQYPLDSYKSLPVFILNTSLSHNTIIIEDGRFAMIYEAVDKSGSWQPIEFKTYSWCGNSYSDLNLKKDHFALFKVPEQSGDFNTKLRLKARIGKSIFYSNEISGSINLSQFEFSKNQESPYDWHYIMDSDNSNSIFLDK